MDHLDDYSRYVSHPRYGRGPRFTGLDPETDFEGDVYLHWHSPKDCRIPNTAVAADLSRQSWASVPVTHYFDVIRKCRDCGQPFIFFADEQAHWYEVLGFGLDSDCVRCPPCRRNQQGLARWRERYEELFHLSERSVAETLEMAEGCLVLIEASVFHNRQTQHVRALLNQVKSTPDPGSRARSEALRQRLLKLDSLNQA